MSRTPDPMLGEHGALGPHSARHVAPPPPGVVASAPDEAAMPLRPRRRTGNRIKVAQTLPTRVANAVVPGDEGA